MNKNCKFRRTLIFKQIRNRHNNDLIPLPKFHMDYNILHLEQNRRWLRQKVIDLACNDPTAFTDKFSVPPKCRIDIYKVA